MTYSIVYSSRTGNTKILADAIKEVIGEKCIYFGIPDDEALKADYIFVGFWTDKGCCNSEIKDFLKTVKNKTVFLFGTAGFGENQEYFEKIIERTSKGLGEDVKVDGHYMCQGRMPLSVRKRYEKMLESPVHMPNLQQLIENFDKALTHPDLNDLRKLKDTIKEI